MFYVLYRPTFVTLQTSGVHLHCTSYVVHTYWSIHFRTTLLALRPSILPDVLVYAIDRFHPFDLPIKDTKNLIPRVLYSNLIPIRQLSVYFHPGYDYTCTFFKLNSVIVA